MYLLIAGALALLLVLGSAACRRDPLKLRMAPGILLGLSLLLVGMNVSARWLYFLSSALFAAIALSWLAALFSLRGLAVTRHPPPEVTEGDTAAVRLSVHNPGRRPRRLFLVMDEGWREPGGAEEGGGWRRRLRQRALYLSGKGREAGAEEEGGPAPLDRQVKAFVPRLEPASGIELSVPRLFAVRGIYAGGRIALHSGGWTGLASSLRRVPAPAPVTVLPRYVDLERFPAADESFPARRARADARPDRSGADFYGIREYREGDPLRHVHWRSTARAGRLMVRELEREPGLLLSVLVGNEKGWDLGPRGDSRLDNAARIAASLLLCAARSRRPARLAYARGDRLISLEPGGFDAARAELAGLSDSGSLSPEEMVRRAGEALPAGSTRVVVAPSRRRDPAALAGAAPARTGVGLVALDAASFGPVPRGREAFSPEELAGWAGAPPPGLSFFLVFAKGDDLEACLRAPLPITSA